MPPLSLKQISDGIISNFKIPKSPPSCDFPSDVLKHMKKNANPKQAIKLSKLNKYFIQEKCPFIYFGDNIHAHNNSVSFCNNLEHKNYKINEIPNNLGIGIRFIVHYENLLPQLISKILICDLKRLYINQDAKLFFEDFKFLTSSKSFFELSLHGKVVDKDEIVPYEILLENVPSLRCFFISRLSPLHLTNNFFEKFCASNLEELYLCSLTKFFDVESFLNSMKKKPNLRIHLRFENFVDPGKVNAYIDKLVAAGIPDSRPPQFDSGFIDAKRRSQLENLQKAYDLKIHGDL
uniref:Uncharacterized protein n=1 Tax=Panagrolaimus davidi TaxID=227884 RepID=A0A914QW14_9BILA